MKIAVNGSGTDKGLDESIVKKAKEIGKEIAKAGHTLLTGGCDGYPKAAAEGALSVDGEVIVYSPADSEEEHVERYGFCTDKFSSIKYTGRGIPERNIPLVADADAIVISGGKVGTLNEFTLAFFEGKTIGVLKGSGGVSDLIPKIAEVCDKIGEKDMVVVSSKPKELIEKLTSI